MHPWLTRSARVGTILLGGVVLAGCLGEDLGSGPLDAGSNRTVTCLQERGSTDFTNGTNVLRYHGKDPLTITEIDLVYPSGFQVVKAFLVPVRHSTLVGSWSRWPPPNATEVMKGAIPAVGATIGRDGVTEYNLVAHLTRPNIKRRGHASALRLFYTVAGQEWGTIATAYLGIQSDSGSCD